MRPIQLAIVGLFGLAVYQLLNNTANAATSDDNTGSDGTDNTPTLLNLIAPSAINLMPSTAPLQTLAWGAKVDDDFRCTVVNDSAQLGIQPSWLMAVIDSESAGTFSPTIRAPTSTAIGLIQFLTGTAQSLGTTTSALGQMSAVEQLSYVLQYLQPYAGRMHSVGDVYMAVFNPAHLGQDGNTVLYRKGQAGYTANQGFDKQGAGVITIAMVWAWAALKLAQGFLPGNVYVGTICQQQTVNV